MELNDVPFQTARRHRDAVAARLWRFFIIDITNESVYVTARNGLLSATFYFLLIFATLLFCLIPTFAPPSASHFFGGRVEMPPKVPGIFRVIMLSIDVLLAFSLIGTAREAIVPAQICCREGKLGYVWPKHFGRGSSEFRWEQIQKVYGGEDSSGDGTFYYLGIVDTDGTEHRLLLDRIDRQEAVNVARAIRSVIGLPTCEQDGAEFAEQPSATKHSPKQYFRRLSWLLLYPAWLVMMAIHESGHVMAAYLTGAKVIRVSVPLLGFSRTDVVHNSHPAIVAWGGPIAGSLIPLLLWLIAQFNSKALAKPAQFFTGFCLIINGLYLGVGWIDGVGDAGDLIRHGTPRAAMIVFGTVTFAAGLFLWHWLGTDKPRETKD